MIGTRLAHYEITAPIGKGGMGEVYRARDTKLGRDVALKILPAAFSRDEERMARFQREAQVLASLNHPNIGSIYGIERSGDTTALVLELVDGPTLDERIKAGPVPPEEAVAIAREIAEAVEYAHERGIVHRDLKPANVKLTPEGRVKVLDFGLAKALDTAPASGSGTMGTPVSSPTLTSPVISGALTGANVILGTAAYMSPEQARGKPVDRRADVWAFGVILFEMLTGRRLFDGETVSDTLAAVLKVEPDWGLLPASVPHAVRRVIRRCLTKNPAGRLRSVADAALEMEDATAEDGSASAAVPAGSRTRTWIPWGIAAVLALVLLIRGTGSPLSDGGSAEPIHVDLQLPEGCQISSASPPVLSPDGRRIAYGTAGPDGYSLWIRSFDRFEPAVVAEKGGYFPFWSPDSRELAYSTSGELRAYDVSTGSSRRICEMGATRGGCWGEDGTILFTPDSNSPIFRVDAGGGVPTAVTTLDTTLVDSSQRFPVWLPGGKHFLFTFWSNNLDVLRDHGGIWAATPDGAIVRRVLSDACACTYVDPGWLLVRREGKLVAVPFEPETLEATPPGHVIADDVLFNTSTGSVGASACGAGVLAYAESGGEESPTDVVWLDREGRTVETLYDEYFAEYLRVSPSGRRFVAGLSTPGSSAPQDLWVGDLGRKTLTRLSRGLNDSWGPVWSPDEKRLAFTNNDSGRESIYVRDLFATAPRELLFESDSLDLEATDWSRDGRTLLFESMPKSRVTTRIGTLDLETGSAHDILAAAFRQADGLFSPDARWIAYESSESGQQEVCVSPFPEAERRWQISSGGGDLLSWSRDGKEILYENGGKVWTVSVDPAAPDLAPSEPKPLFDLPAGVVDLAAASDHQRFLASIGHDEGSRHPLRVILNWSPDAGS